MGIKILITGTHSTGKSTLLEELKKQEEFKTFKFIGGVTREAKSYGIEINEGGGDNTQLYCGAKDTLNLLQNLKNNIVFDRSILDTMAYSIYLRERRKISENTLIIIKNLEREFREEFDYIFWLRPEFLPVNDGIRSIDLDFQKDIDLIFENLLQIYNYTILTGSVEERINQIKNKVCQKLQNLE